MFSASLVSIVETRPVAALRNLLSTAVHDFAVTSGAMVLYAASCTHVSEPAVAVNRMP